MNIFKTIKEAISDKSVRTATNLYIHFDHQLSPKELTDLSKSIHKKLIGIINVWNIGSSRVYSYFYSN